MKRLKIVRKAVQALFFWGIIIAAAMRIPFASCSYLQIGMLRLVCPMGVLETSLATHTIPWNLIPGFVLVCFLLIILGKAYCAWMCPASFAGRQAALAVGKILPPKLSRKLKKKWTTLNRKFATQMHADSRDAFALLFGMLVGISIFGYPAFSILCPMGVISRNLIEFVSHYSLRYDLIFLIIPVLVALFFNTGWKCACPVGTLRGLLSFPNKTFIPAVQKEKCISCGRCNRNCPVGLAPEHGEFDPSRCSKCMECIAACPTSAIKLLKMRKK